MIFTNDTVNLEWRTLDDKPKHWQKVLAVSAYGNMAVCRYDARTYDFMLCFQDCYDDDAIKSFKDIISDAAWKAVKDLSIKNISKKNVDFIKKIIFENIDDYILEYSENENVSSCYFAAEYWCKLPPLPFDEILFGNDKGADSYEFKVFDFLDEIAPAIRQAFYKIAGQKNEAGNDS